MKCNICGCESVPFDRARILDKYDIQYYRCESCGFIQTENPYWLDEAYSNAITDLDIGLLIRNNYVSKVVSGILHTWFSGRIKGLDYGAGYGVLVRMMRDKGYDFCWYDKYCVNLFAKQFVKQDNEHYDVVTAFELLEHLDKPMEDISHLLQLGDTLIFSTTLVANPAPKIADWWYYVPEAGQHVSFYTRQSMKYIAAYHHKHYVGINDIHIISDKVISYTKLKLVYYLSQHVNRLFQQQSLLASDYAAMTGKHID